MNINHEEYLDLNFSEKKAYWLDHIDDAMSSNESCKKYCLDHNLSYQMFNKWKKKLGFVQQPPKDPSPSGFSKISLSEVPEPAETPEVLLSSLPCPKWTALFLKELLK